MCGPFSTTSTAKHKYYVIFVDDFSCKCWIFFMQNKDQTFSKFCEFKAHVEKNTGRKVKALKSDNDGEYVFNKFNNFCALEGIRWELITPHNPQKMSWVKGRTKALWEMHRQCYMIRAYHCTCGLNHATQLYMCRVGALIGFSRLIHQNNIFQLIN